MKYVWQDLPKPLNVFTTRSTAMINLNTGKAEQFYSANTKLVMYQKCVTPDKTYYRTYSAFHHCLNLAFEASAFGLPNEKASLAPTKGDILIQTTKLAKTRKKPVKKQKVAPKKPTVKSEELPAKKKTLLQKLFGRFKWRKH